MTVWKYATPLDKLGDIVEFVMPMGARVLSVGAQNDSLCLWALVDEHAPPRSRTFRVAGTGHPLDQSSANRFVGTVQFTGGSFVVHVFEV